MLHIKKLISMPFPINNPTLESRIKDNALIFDIETTGLSPHKSQVVLIGFARFDKKGRFVLNQLFLDDPSEEAEMLSIFHRIAASSGFFITYNGNSFDLPFLNARMKKHSNNADLDSFYNIDLMRILKSNHFNLPLTNYKLKTVEKYMGISRSDTISGKESVELYNNYLSDKNPLNREKILLHNSDDIVSLFNLLKVFELPENPEIFFDFTNEIIIDNISFRIQSFKSFGDFIYASGISTVKHKHDYSYNYNSFSFYLNSNNGSFDFRIPVLHQEIDGKAYSLIDYQSIIFASDCINSFIFANPDRMVLSTDGIIEKINLIGLLTIILEKIFKP